MRKGTTSSADRTRLATLRRKPQEALYTSAQLNRLRRDGLASAEPLHRPSGQPSKFWEWSITPAGIEELENGK